MKQLFIILLFTIVSFLTTAQTFNFTKIEADFSNSHTSVDQKNFKININDSTVVVEVLSIPNGIEWFGEEADGEYKILNKQNNFSFVVESPDHQIFSVLILKDSVLIEGSYQNEQQRYNFYN